MSSYADAETIARMTALWRDSSPVKKRHTKTSIFLCRLLIFVPTKHYEKLPPPQFLLRCRGATCYRFSLRVSHHIFVTASQGELPYIFMVVKIRFTLIITHSPAAAALYEVKATFYARARHSSSLRSNTGTKIVTTSCTTQRLTRREHQATGLSLQVFIFYFLGGSVFVTL